ncbi:MAG: XdhC/CoxI family protein [Candidatus Izemoplasmatales bacterium]|nr:XdhC/CoxI family protein [Candidatus Izemoplasmatales bacterium]
MDIIYEKILEYQKKGIPMILVTAVEKEGAGPVEVGKKMIVTDTKEYFGTVGGGKLEYYAINKCASLFRSRKPLLERYALTESEIIPNALTLPMVCGGVVTLFYEYLGSKEDVYIFGAGHVGQALANILKTMNFHVKVIDERKQIIDAFQNADMLYNQGFVDFIENVGIKEDSFVVVCTPSHEYDYHVINKVLELGLKPKYLGMLCSPVKLNDYLDKTYETFGKNVNLKHFYAPIGLDLGGNKPEDIAISITSEILAISNHKQNHSHMRETNHGKYRYWED